MLRCAMVAVHKSDIHHIDLHFPGEATPPQFMANERNIALKTLLDHSHFKLNQNGNAPYGVELSIQDNRLIFEVEDQKQTPLPMLVLSLKPYRRIIKDYFMMIESYESIRATGNQVKLEAIDMGRRGLHNEGAEMMIDRLSDKIDMDLETARGFFTLICCLQAGPKYRT